MKGDEEVVGVTPVLELWPGSLDGDVVVVTGLSFTSRLFFGGASLYMSTIAGDEPGEPVRLGLENGERNEERVRLNMVDFFFKGSFSVIFTCFL